MATYSDDCACSGSTLLLDSACVSVSCCSRCWSRRQRTSRTAGGGQEATHLRPRLTIREGRDQRWLTRGGSVAANYEREVRGGADLPDVELIVRAAADRHGRGHGLITGDVLRPRAHILHLHQQRVRPARQPEHGEVPRSVNDGRRRQSSGRREGGRLQAGRPADCGAQRAVPDIRVWVTEATRRAGGWRRWPTAGRT
jgi:hypothetical protein